MADVKGAGKSFTDIISRDPSQDPLIPEPVAREVIQETVTASAMLSLGQRVTMSTAKTRQPVLSALPNAYWVSGDTGLKQTTAQDWENLELVAEELAVIVPVPEAYISDSQVPIWEQVRPRLAEAIGRAVDQACLFGVNKPASWTSPSIVDGAIAANNTVTNADLALGVSSAGQKLAKQGYSINGFAAAPGQQWSLIGLRSNEGVPIYTPSLSAGQPSGLFGFPLNEVNNGSWDESKAKLVAGDWRKAIVGVRQDITFKIFDQGVITDADGKVLLNLMQQDSVAMRVVFRVGYAVANPVTALEGDKSKRFAFHVVK